MRDVSGLSSLFSSGGGSGGNNLGIGDRGVSVVVSGVSSGGSSVVVSGDGGGSIVVSGDRGSSVSIGHGSVSIGNRGLSIGDRGGNSDGLLVNVGLRGNLDINVGLSSDLLISEAEDFTEVDCLLNSITSIYEFLLTFQ